MVVTTRFKTTWPTICSSQNATNYIDTIGIFKGAQGTNVISIGNTHILNFTTALIAAVQVYRTDDTAYLAIRRVLVIYRNITGVEDIFQITTVPIAGNAADNI